MPRPLSLSLLLLPVLAACAADPVAPRPDQPVDSASVAQVAAALPACTRHWLFAANGNWNVAGNWNPAGVPRVGDVVCIDAVGAYTVTVDTAIADLSALILGGRSVQAKLLYPAGAPTGVWWFTNGIQIVAGSTLHIRGDLFGILPLGPLLIDGTLKVDAGAFLAGFQGDSVVIRGSVDCAAISCSLSAARFLRTSGTLSATGTGRLQLDGAKQGVLIQGGSFSGSGTITSSSTTHWGAGTIPARLTDGTARFEQVGDTLFLEADSLVGAVNLQVLSFVPHLAALRGDIGAGVHLFATTTPGTLDTLSIASASGGPVTNRGILTFQPSWGQFKVLGPGLINLGTVEANQPTGITELATDSVVNRGAFSIPGHLTVSGNLNFLRNAGTMNVTGAGELELSAAELIAEQGSSIIGSMLITGSTVSGTGRIGDVTSVGSQFEPGSPIGMLTVGRLVLDNSSSVGIEVAGTTNYDRLRVLNAITYAGSLSIREVAPFVSATCGQMLPVITDHSPGSRGAFTKFQGLSPAIARAWRIYNPVDTLYLVGHNPIVPVSAAPSAVTVAEGGASASYSVCLRSAPSSDVTVAPASSLGQVAAMAPLVFTSTTWAPPKTVTVTAIDDALYEPVPSVDDIQHTTTSTDPQYVHAFLASVPATVTDNDGSANLELTLVSAPPVAAVGTNFTLQLRDDNLGPDVSPGATLNIPASVGYGYVSSSGVLSCAYDAVTGTTCQLGSLASGLTQTASITFTALVAGSYSTAYTLSSVQFDSNLNNNTRVQLITIQ